MAWSVGLDQTAFVNEDRDEQDEQVWDAGVVGRILCVLPVLGFVATVVFASEHFPIDEVWPFSILLAGFPALILRPAVRITPTELVIRHPIGSERFPRAEVASARFNYAGLIIRTRRGGSAIAFILPKWTSTELSGDEPPPDSAAYQITRWAQLADPGTRVEGPPR
ncbi:PH domain-containing protein [Kribbella deserti]|uniref:PH domain-containing protein n=1 Tax=Kribbella deserti TaxID=1926257 RepID=A0ABV6QTR4_9ACTN